MKFSAKQTTVKTVKTDAVALGVFKDEVKGADISQINSALKGYLKQSAKEGKFTGKSGQILFLDTLGAIPAKKILLIGLGDKTEANLDTLRKASAKVARAMRAVGAKNFATTLAKTSIKKAGAFLKSQAVAEGAILALYTFNTFKSKTEEPKKVDSLTLIAGSGPEEAQFAKGARKGRILSESAYITRDLINTPGNVATPTFLANTAKKIARRHNIKIKVLTPKDIEKAKMGALMAVAKGSHEPARFIIMEWMKGPKGRKPVVLVGKGLTFDTGGISIKPSANMEEMKSDMSGGAAVIGAMRAIALLKMRVNVVGLVPSTENMPGGSAVKPGDVVTGLSGVTMEIINTDAEGRLILSDALAYADKYKPDCVVDIATLTGACMVALGDFASGLFGTDQELIDQIKDAGEDTGERCWPLPLWAEYEAQIKSDVADIRNVGPRAGGAITAAAFLKKSVKGKWAHIDIAGTAYHPKSRGYLTKGAAGLGPRLFVSFIEKRLGK